MAAIAGAIQSDVELDGARRFALKPGQVQPSKGGQSVACPRLRLRVGTPCGLCPPYKAAIRPDKKHVPIGRIIVFHCRSGRGFDGVPPVTSHLSGSMN
jgi:hypothetical protein